MRLSRGAGSVIVIDNVVRKGAVIDAASDLTPTCRAFVDSTSAAAERRVNTTTLQTVGAKDYDGFAVALVVGGG